MIKLYYDDGKWVTKEQKIERMRLRDEFYDDLYDGAFNKSTIIGTNVNRGREEVD